MAGEPIKAHYRAFYPEVRFFTSSYAKVDSRLAYGHFSGPGEYATTVTRPDLFADYLKRQIGLIIANHGVPAAVGYSQTPIPLHFAFAEGHHVEGSVADRFSRPLRDVFDVPDLSMTDDRIANGDYDGPANAPQPLAPFTAPRTDYSLHRLAHYTATRPRFFQNYVLFTNYQFYLDEFVTKARRMIAKGARLVGACCGSTPDHLRAMAAALVPATR